MDLIDQLLSLTFRSSDVLSDVAKLRDFVASALKIDKSAVKVDALIDERRFEVSLIKVEGHKYFLNKLNNLLTTKKPVDEVIDDFYDNLEKEAFDLLK
jgi:hypothetical protein